MPNAQIRGHLDERDAAAYVDGRVSGGDRASMDAHLSVCGDCRAEVIEVSRILRTMPRIGRFLRYLRDRALLA